MKYLGNDTIYKDGHLVARERLLEELRCITILATGRAHGKRDLADLAILRGTPADMFEKKILEDIGDPPPRALGEIGMTQKEIRQWSLCRHLLSDRFRNVDSLERECDGAVCKQLDIPSDPLVLHVPAEIQQRDLNTAVGSAGGFLVGTNVIGFTPALRNRSVVRRLGATMLPGLRGDSSIPSVVTSSTTVWLNEEDAVAPESQPVLADLPLSPKTVAAYVELSRKVVKQATPSVEALVMTDLGGVVAQAVDIGALNGSGASGEPTGLLNVTGIGTFSGTSLGSDGDEPFRFPFSFDLGRDNAGGAIVCLSAPCWLSRRDERRSSRQLIAPPSSAAMSALLRDTRRHCE